VLNAYMLVCMMYRKDTEQMMKSINASFQVSIFCLPHDVIEVVVFLKQLLNIKYFN